MTLAKLVRTISGGVNGARAAKSSSEYRRIHTPALVRPARPARCWADACEIFSMGNRCTLRRVS
jgi:hypothetical protein